MMRTVFLIMYLPSIRTDAGLTLEGFWRSEPRNPSFMIQKCSAEQDFLPKDRRDFSVTYFFQYLIYGLQLGSVYALLALGYTMVYGIVGMINFAHGDFLMIGALGSWASVTTR